MDDMIDANRRVLGAIRDIRAIIETVVAAVPDEIGGNGRMVTDAILDGLVAELYDRGGYRPTEQPCEQVIFFAVEAVLDHGRQAEKEPLLGLYYRVSRMLAGDLDSHYPDLDLDEEED